MVSAIVPLLARLDLRPRRIIPSKPIQYHGRGPGLLGGAEGLAGEWLEVLGEAFFGDLLEGRLAQTFGELVLSGARQRPPQKPVDHRPDRPPPVAARVEPGILWARARWKRPSQPRVTNKGRRSEGLQDGREAPRSQASSHQRGETRHRARLQRLGGAQVVVEV